VLPADGEVRNVPLLAAIELEDPTSACFILVRSVETDSSQVLIFF
jgi:hypothetical protein